ncbi:uncharacterized protein C8Q71DRAFT_719791 [Rhodofomes roseus]|uniref:Uncharacterized protein n=1 Tax=Rhodofomes roseus TaxID=34475 RepID=A0ABQ8KZ03_9APHY|nr:uncharacterized protein C8Q71DRAFT_719791 [Rhodofomes roseus]KAH9844223.1 hypothetical protein C8Q71DRAFT_719791 [Rhodofomes roseus]
MPTQDETTLPSPPTQVTVVVPDQVEPLSTTQGGNTPTLNPHENPWRPTTATPLTFINVTPETLTSTEVVTNPAHRDLSEPPTQTQSTMAADGSKAPTTEGTEAGGRKEEGPQQNPITRPVTKTTSEKDRVKHKKKKNKQEKQKDQGAAVGVGPPPLPVEPAKGPVEEEARADAELGKKRRRTTVDLGDEDEAGTTDRRQDAERDTPNQISHLANLTADLTSLSPPPADGYYSDGGLSYVDLDTEMVVHDDNIESAMEVDQLAPAPPLFFAQTIVAPTNTAVADPQTPTSIVRNPSQPNATTYLPPAFRSNVLQATPQSPTPTNLRDLRFTRYPATTSNVPPIPALHTVTRGNIAEGQSSRTSSSASMRSQQPPQHEPSGPGPSGQHQPQPTPAPRILNFITIRGPTAATRRPANNWPAVHGRDAFAWTENMMKKQHEAWADIARTQPTALIQMPGCGADEAETAGKVENITKMIKDYLNVHRFVITPPVAVLRTGKRNKAPYWLLLHEVSLRDCNKILSQEWLDTAEGTINCRPLTADNPQYAGAWRYASRFGAKDKNYTGVFLRAFQGDALQSLVVSYLANDISEGGHWSAHTLEDAYYTWLSTIHADELPLSHGEGRPDPIVRLYCESPTYDTEKWKVFCKELRYPAGTTPTPLALAASRGRVGETTTTIAEDAGEVEAEVTGEDEAVAAEETVRGEVCSHPLGRLVSSCPVAPPPPMIHTYHSTFKTYILDMHTDELPS